MFEKFRNLMCVHYFLCVCFHGLTVLYILVQFCKHVCGMVCLHSEIHYPSVWEWLLCNLCSMTDIVYNVMNKMIYFRVFCLSTFTRILYDPTNKLPFVIFRYK